jgi:chemotaxis protein CheD
MRRVDDVVLAPGDFFFGGEGLRIRTLLGSCVAITLWHPALRIGGMCHYLVPSRRHPADPGGLDGRYATEAIAMFLRESGRRATVPKDYQVKMFGGGSQFQDPAGLPGFDVPSNNIEAGLHLLEQHGFSLSAKHLGGTGHREVVLDLANGQVWLRHVDRISIGSPA